MGFDVFRIANVSSHGREGRVESFDVADLQRHALLPRGVTRSVAFGRRQSQRLFDEQRNSAAQQFHSDCVMIGRRCRDNCGFDFADQ